MMKVLNKKWGMGCNRCILLFPVLVLLVLSSNVRAAGYQVEDRDTVARVGKDRVMVKGKVLDEKGNPLPGADVFVTNSDEKTITGKNGKFKLVVDKGAKLVFSCLGRKNKIVRAKAKKEMRVVLVPDEYVYERAPIFFGDIQQYISRNIKYPKDAFDFKIQGKVYVQFFVETDGRVVDVKVLRSVYHSLDEEACRVIRTMPRWKPGIHKGRPVRVSYTVPINFRLN